MTTELKFERSYYFYLDVLRKSGVTNMLGAGKYLMEEFHLDHQEARDVLSDWMKTFGEREGGTTE